MSGFHKKLSIHKQAVELDLAYGLSFANPLAPYKKLTEYLELEKIVKNQITQTK